MYTKVITNAQTGKVTEIPMTQGEIDALKPSAEQVRGERNELLSASDWVIGFAYEKSEPVPEAWATYRQALRDVPEQEGFPENVIWPTPPE